jgi:hypothetical protein
MRWTLAKVRSVSSFELRFGYAIQSPSAGASVRFSFREPPFELCLTGREIDDDVGARLRAEFRCERRPGVVAFSQR